MSLVQAVGTQASTAKWIGMFLIVAGFLSLVSPLAAGLSVTVVVGAMMLVSGVAQTFLAFRGGAIGETITLILIGLLGVFAGGYMLFQPGAGLAVLTLMLAGYFAAHGILEIIAAFGARPSAGWGWLLFGGAVSLALGVMVWRQFPVSGAWAVGTLVGARLLVSGSALMSIGSAAKRLAGAAGVARHESRESLLSAATWTLFGTGIEYMLGRRVKKDDRRGDSSRLQLVGEYAI